MSQKRTSVAADGYPRKTVDSQEEWARERRVTRAKASLRDYVLLTRHGCRVVRPHEHTEAGSRAGNVRTHAPAGDGAAKPDTGTSQP